MRGPTSSRPFAGSTTRTGTPASRIWSIASSGPVVVSASTRSGLRDRTLSAETSWLRVTTGSFSACAKVAVMSRATTRSPSPSVKTISLRLPESGTIRSASLTVTFPPSDDRTVTGSWGTGVSASGSTRSAAASALAAGAPSGELSEEQAVTVSASTASSAPATRVRRRRTVAWFLSSDRAGLCVVHRWAGGAPSAFRGAGLYRYAAPPRGATGPRTVGQPTTRSPPLLSHPMLPASEDIA
jgi:hypothetical protein